MSEAQLFDENKSGGAPGIGENDEKIANGVRLMAAAQEKRGRLSHFGTTYEDEKLIGSPPLLLTRNPGKTLGELLSDEDLLKKLDGLAEFQESAQALLKTEPDDTWAQDDLAYALRELPAAIKYLDSIGRLPEKYRNRQN